MEMYIDKENLKNIFKQSEHPLYEDAVRAMKQQLDVRFNFTKQEARDDEILSYIMPVFNEGVSYEVEHEFLDVPFPARPVRIDDNLIAQAKQSAFLIDDAEDAIRECQRYGALHFYPIGQEFSFFERIYLFQKDGQFTNSLRIGSNQFQRWNQLSHYFPFLVDIIVLDQYLFSKKQQLNNNLISFLKTLQQGKTTQINLVAFVRGSQFDAEFDTTKDIIDLIKQSFDQVSLPLPNVTIIIWKETPDPKNANRKYLDTMAEHDRTVLTNYVRIKSGGSLNMFDFEGRQIARVREFDLVSLARRQYKVLCDELIGDLQSIIKSYRANCPENILGDMKSNFLTFS